jgi:hypothetical protein
MTDSKVVKHYTFNGLPLLASFLYMTRENISKEDVNSLNNKEK